MRTTYIKFICIVIILMIADKCKAQIYLYAQDTTKVIMIVADTTTVQYGTSWEVLRKSGIVYWFKGYTISYKKAAIPPKQNQNGKDIIVGEAWFTYIRYFHDDFSELTSNWVVIHTIKR